MSINLEGIFLTFLLFHNLSLFIPRKRRPWYLQGFLVLALLAACATLYLHGFYWFLFPGYALLALQSLLNLLLYFLSPRRVTVPSVIARLGYSFPGVLISLGSLFLLFVFPLRAPEPTGPWKVGLGVFENGAGSYLVYYPLASSEGERSLNANLPQKFLWDDNLAKMDRAIYTAGVPASGALSLVVLDPPQGSSGEDFSLLLSELASWGLVCGAPKSPEPSASRVFQTLSLDNLLENLNEEKLKKSEDSLSLFASMDPKDLLLGTRKAMTSLGLKFNGRTALITQRVPMSLEGWTSVVFWNSQKSTFGRPADLVLSSDKGPSGSWGINWPQASPYDWVENSYNRPWLTLLSRGTLAGETIRKERQSLVRGFLLWKLRDGDPGVFASFQGIPDNLRILSPE